MTECIQCGQNTGEVCRACHRTVEPFTDAEVQNICDRWDKTDPTLQRHVVAVACAMLHDARSEVARCHDEIAQLKQALQPFACYARDVDKLSPGPGDEEPIQDYVVVSLGDQVVAIAPTVGHCREARVAIQKARGADNEPIQSR
jgi:hypothetical protein